MPDSAKPAAQPRATETAASGAPPGFWRRAALFPQIYVWYVFFAALDIMFTWIILYWGGRELNGLASWALDLAGLPGLVLFKFALVMVVIAVCEIVGRRDLRVGRKLAEWSVAVTLIPVVLALWQLGRHVAIISGNLFDE